MRRPEELGDIRKDAVDRARTEINLYLRKHQRRMVTDAVNYITAAWTANPGFDPEQGAWEAVKFASQGQLTITGSVNGHEHEVVNDDPKPKSRARKAARKRSAA